jgi:cytochrome c oxidase subunit 2
MHKWLMFVLFIGASIFGLVAVMLVAPHGAEEELAPPKENELRIVATNYQFDKAEYKVKQGETLTVSLVNRQGAHGVAIDELGVKLEGDQLTQEVTFDKPGTYKLYCSVPCGIGHQDMVSTLIVE